MKKSDLFDGGIFVDDSIIWRNAAEIKPPCSDAYLCITDAGNIMILEYSNLRRAFNVTDDNYSDANSIEVLAWAPVPSFREFFRRIRPFLDEFRPFDSDDNLTDFDIDSDELPDDDLADEIMAEFDACLDSEV